MRLFRLVTLLLIVSALLSGASPVAAQGCEGLVNAGFEDGFTERGAGELYVAVGWHYWYQDGPFQEDGYYRRPEFKGEDARIHTNRRIHSGNWAQKFFTTYSTHNAGLWQQVNVPVGSRLTFSAWVQIWSSQEPDPGTVVDPGNYRVYVGIDPTGGTDWSSPNIVWSEPQMAYNTWLNPSVSTVAKAGTITVYLRGHPEFRNRFNDSYWDDACLTIVRPKPTNTPIPPPTKTPTITPTPTVTPTPEPATLCVRVYSDLNGNGQEDAGDTLLAGAQIHLGGPGGTPLERIAYDGQGPHCFTLPAGRYGLLGIAPRGYVASAADSWTGDLEPGGKVEVTFWHQPLPTPTLTPTNTPTLTHTPTQTPTNTPTFTPTPTFTRTPRPTFTPVPTATPLSGAGRVLRGFHSVSGILAGLAGVALITAALFLRRRV